MDVRTEQGLVIKKYGGFYYVQNTDREVFECRLRGKIKTEVLTGDYVLFSPLPGYKGILEQILPRDNELYRPKIANIDMVLLVFSFDEPAPSLELLDRLLVLSHFNLLIPVIILNKRDLAIHPRALFIKEYYPGLEYPVLETCAIKGLGIDAVEEIVRNNIAVLAGPSGSGKSSLLNHLIKGVNVKTQEVSRKIGRGKHTTRHVELFPLESGGYIADTPGFSVLDLPKIPPQKLGEYFPEIRRHSRNCKFADCLHAGERDCRVKDAVNEEVIPASRYKNYQDMLEALLEKERCYR